MQSHRHEKQSSAVHINGFVFLPEKNYIIRNLFVLTGNIYE